VLFGEGSANLVDGCNFLAGTLFIRLSTSMGAGITMVPLPQRLLIFSVIFSTLGSPLLSWSFSVQDGFFLGTEAYLEAILAEGFNQIFARRTV